MDPLATCQTYVACLLESIDAMESRTDIDAAGDKIQQITGLL